MYKVTRSTKHHQELEAKSATVIQRFFRGYHDRKQYQIKPLKKEQAADYGAIFWSDTPQINLTEEKLQLPGKTAIIGNSVMRPVRIAYNLLSKGKVEQAKLFIVDFDWKVIELWHALKDVFLQNPRKNRSFCEKLRSMLQDNCALMAPAEQKDDISFEATRSQQWIEANDFHLIRKLIIDAALIHQNWKNTSAFTKLKAILDRTNYQQCVVYGSNIISLSEEPDAERIANNIALLQPRLSIHENFEPFLGLPTAAIVTQQFQPKAILKALKEKMSFVSPPIMVIRGHGFYFVSPYDDIVKTYMQVNSAVQNLTAQNGYRLDPAMHPFLADVLLKMAGINDNISSYYYEASRGYYYCIFHLPLSTARADEVIDGLKRRFPAVTFRMSLFAESEPREGLPLRIGIRMDELLDELLPQIPLYLHQNPDLLARYEALPLGNAFNQLVRQFAEIFTPYNISIRDSNCVEETLFEIVRRDLEARGERLAAENLEYCSFSEHPGHPEQTIFTMSISQESARQIVNYFNRKEQDSAHLGEVEQTDRVSFIVKNTVLSSGDFLNAMSNVALSKYISTIPVQANNQAEDSEDEHNTKRVKLSGG